MLTERAGSAKPPRKMPTRKEWDPLYGDGIHDDAPALQSMMNQQSQHGEIVELPAGTYAIAQTLHVPDEVRELRGGGATLIGLRELPDGMVHFTADSLCWRASELCFRPFGSAEKNDHGDIRKMYGRG